MNDLSAKLGGRLTVGLLPLKEAILVRIQTPQLCVLVKEMDR